MHNHVGKGLIQMGTWAVGVGFWLTEFSNLHRGHESQKKQMKEDLGHWIRSADSFSLNEAWI